MGKNEDVLKVGIIWASPYATNLGVAALAYSSIILLNDIANEKGIKVSFTFIGSNKWGKDEINVFGNIICFNNVFGADYLRFKTWLLFLLKPLQYKLLNLLKLDVIFDIAAGDSFSDIYGDKRFRKILNSKILFKWLGKTQILLPQTIGPFAKEANERLAFKTLSSVEMVLCRDSKSYDYCSNFLALNTIDELIDIAFYLPFEKKIFNELKINIGINISGLLWNGGYTNNNQFSLQSNYRKLIEDIIAYFSSIQNVQIHLVAHVLHTKPSIEDDYIICKDFLEDNQNLVLAPFFKSPIEAKSYISGLDFFIGARMHSCIAAFSTGVPVFPLSYSRKFNGLFAGTLNYTWIGDCVYENEDTILKNLKEAFNNRNSLKEYIYNTNNSIVKERLSKLRYIVSNKMFKKA